MAYTSPSEIDLTDDPSGLFAWLNDVTNYWFSNGLLISIWTICFISYLATNKDDFAGASAVSSYITVVLALIGWLMGMVHGMAFSICLGLSLLSTAWLLNEKRN